ncbi:MAG: hypothetical protein LBK97_03705, partial [Prevotellaceae bacterium]|nr:hypothetical protein [Prevotellaceae bacterium]
QKVPSAKADGNILSQEIKKTVNLFHNNSLVAARNGYSQYDIKHTQWSRQPFQKTERAGRNQFKTAI